MVLFNFSHFPPKNHCVRNFATDACGYFSSSMFMIFTAFQRLVDSDDCPAPVSRPAFDSACESVCGLASLQ